MPIVRTEWSAHLRNVLLLSFHWASLRKLCAALVQSSGWRPEWWTSCRRRTWWRRWRVCVFIAELCLARQKEEAGTLFFAQINESFCNSHHCVEQSLLETQGEGEAVQDIHQHAGKGPRLCIVGAISQFGPLVWADPHGTGYVCNHRWQTQKVSQCLLVVNS